LAKAWPEGWQLVLFYMHLIFICDCNYYLLAGPFDYLFNYLDWNIWCNKDYCCILWCVKLLQSILNYLFYIYIPAATYVLSFDQIVQKLEFAVSRCVSAKQIP
jgi:hypothetical protein